MLHGVTQRSRAWVQRRAHEHGGTVGQCLRPQLQQLRVRDDPAARRASMLHSMSARTRQTPLTQANSELSMLSTARWALCAEHVHCHLAVGAASSTLHGSHRQRRHARLRGIAPTSTPLERLEAFVQQCETNALPPNTKHGRVAAPLLVAALHPRPPSRSCAVLFCVSPLRAGNNMRATRLYRSAACHSEETVGRLLQRLLNQSRF